MIKLYKNTKSNIGRGVIVDECGVPCKRRIKAVAAVTDGLGTRMVIDVSRGLPKPDRRWVCMQEHRLLEDVWDNWRTYYKDALPRENAVVKDYERRWDELREAWGDEETLRQAYNKHVARRDWLKVMVDRLDQAQLKRKVLRNFARKVLHAFAGQVIAGEQDDQVVQKNEE